MKNWVIEGRMIDSWALVGYGMEVDANKLQTTKADDRGRVYLGTEYANKRVTVPVVEVESETPDEEELAAAYREVAESASDLSDQWDEASDEAWSGLDGRATTPIFGAVMSLSFDSIQLRGTKCGKQALRWWSKMMSGTGTLLLQSSHLRLERTEAIPLRRESRRLRRE